MGIFSWDGESEDVASDTSDSALAQLGFDAHDATPMPRISDAVPVEAEAPVAPLAPAAPVAPVTDALAAPPPTGSDVTAPTDQPMTRRELRERERAAALKAAEAAEERAETVAFASAEPPEALSRVIVAPPASTQSLTPMVSPASTVAPPASTAAPAPADAPSAPLVTSPEAPASLTVGVEQIFAPSATSSAWLSPAEASDEPSHVPEKKVSPLVRIASARRFRRTPTPAIAQAGTSSSASRPTASRSPRRTPLKRRILARLMSTGAMAGAALMLVATSLPANAFLPAEAAPMNAAVQSDTAVAAPVAAEVQSMKAAATAASPVLTRDGYTAVSLQEQIFLKYGNRNFAYTANATGAIRWPFPIAVPISDGYGYRVSPCSGCSSDHQGVDFTPGAGTAIGVIADGVVIGVNDVDWSYGQHVMVEHVINGQTIQSMYAHMQTGSIRVQVGDVVKVGDTLGLVGSTGSSTGAHLHLEIHVEGVPVDPFAWLQANAG